jgi:hypothetical protein
MSSLQKKAQQEQSNLQHAFGFSIDELLKNKAGNISQAQQLRLKKHNRIKRTGGYAASVTFGLVATGFSAFVALSNVQGLEQARPFLLGFSGFLLLIFSIVFLYSTALRRHQKKVTVTTLEGPVKTWSKDIKNRYQVVFATAYYYQFYRRVFQFESEEQFRAIEMGTSYRFYVIKNGRVPIILSVEVLKA